MPSPPLSKQEMGDRQAEPANGDRTKGWLLLPPLAPSNYHVTALVLC